MVASPRFRWVCGVCGGPRVPGSSGKNAPLARARVAQTAAFGWSAGAIALAMTGALTSGMAALLWTAVPTLGVVVGVVGALFLLFAWRSSARAGKRRKDADDAVKEGWRQAVRSILATDGRQTTAAALARQMRIEEAEADELLTDLAAHDELRVDIDDGSVRFRVPKPDAVTDADADSDADSDSAKRAKRA